VAGPLRGVQVERVAADNRFGTAAALVSRSWPSTAPVVYVASGHTFPDALSAGALAPLQQAPLLLIEACGVPNVVRDELARLQPDRIVVLGGTGTICDSAEHQLAGEPVIGRKTGI